MVSGAVDDPPINANQSEFFVSARRVEGDSGVTLKVSVTDVNDNQFTTDARGPVAAVAHSKGGASRETPARTCSSVTESSASTPALRSTKSPRGFASAPKSSLG